MYTIVQLCCFDCRRFQNIYFIKNNPIYFITFNIPFATDSVFKIYKNGIFIRDFALNDN